MNTKRTLTPEELSALSSQIPTPIEYMAATDPKFVRRKYLEYLNIEISNLIGGLNDRLIVLIPPRHGKTYFCIERLASYYLGLFQDHKFMACSYSEVLSRQSGGAAKRHFEEHASRIFGAKLHDSHTADDWWMTSENGNMYSVQMGGTLKGRGYHFAVLDDYLKNLKEAQSQLVRDDQWHWFWGDFMTRAEHDRAPVAIIAARAHEDDLVGRILANVEAGVDRPWKVLKFPALAEEEDILGRKPGDALLPEVYGKDWLENQRANDPLAFATQYQQRPVPLEGGQFKEEWFRDCYVPAAPDGSSYCRYWDRASSVRGDYTVGALMARSPSGVFYIVDIARGRWDAGTRDGMITRTAQSDNARYGYVLVRGEQEGGSAGKDAGEQFVKMLAGYDVKVGVSTGKKEVRAAPLEAQFKIGNVKLVRSSWNKPLIHEFLMFPNGKHDDQVDACSGAFNELALAFPTHWGSAPFAGFRGRVAG